MNYNKDKDFEIDEETMNIFREYVEVANIEDALPALLNIPELKKLEFVRDCLKKNVGGKNIKIETLLHKPYKQYGSIIITGKNIVFNNPKLLSLTSKLASHIEMNALTNGSVRIIVTFSNLVVR